MVKILFPLLFFCFIFSCKKEDKPIPPDVSTETVTEKKQETEAVSTKNNLEKEEKVEKEKTAEKTAENNPKKTSEKKTTSSLKKTLLGQVNYKTDARFVKVEKKYTHKTIYLRKEAYRAFVEMAESAQKEGIQLRIISGARNFNHQKSIWSRKWKQRTQFPPKERAVNILKFSSMPMTSRHHWGTDIDLNSLNNSYFENGKGKKLYQWLNAHAAEYGFCQVYTSKISGRKGYEEEKWHWSYMPLASQLLEQYNQNISLEDISGFSGSEIAPQLDVIDNFVNGVDNCDLK